MRVKCPHCDAPARCRSSKPMSPTSREQKLQCTNVECAHTWVAVTEAVRTIAPSMTPNPKVHIPLSPRSPAYVPPETKQMGLALEGGAPAR
ncbi:MAG: ogr/Delta-like zinc finger family protein [Pseudomonadota bacterium]